MRRKNSWKRSFSRAIIKEGKRR